MTAVVIAILVMLEFLSLFLGLVIGFLMHPYLVERFPAKKPDAAVAPVKEPSTEEIERAKHIANAFNYRGLPQGSKKDGVKL